MREVRKHLCEKDGLFLSGVRAAYSPMPLDMHNFIRRVEVWTYLLERQDSLTAFSARFYARRCIHDYPHI